jgi:hypothetical protein
MTSGPSRSIGASPQRTRATAVVVLVAALVLGACTLPPPYEGPADGPEVVVVGDSLVEFGAPRIKPALTGEGWRVSLHGEATLSTRAAQPRFVGASIAAPGAVVVVTTANDAFDLYRGLISSSQQAAVLDEAFGALDGVPCSVWVLLNEHASFYGFPQWAPVVNSMVMARASVRPHVRLLDWRDAVLDHPEWFQSDRFHHTDAGNRAFADAIRNTLATCPGAP